MNHLLEALMQRFRNLVVNVGKGSSSHDLFGHFSLKFTLKNFSANFTSNSRRKTLALQYIAKTWLFSNILNKNR